jgi:hypothetical protein
MALLKLGRKEEAVSRFNKLISFGLQHMEDHIKIDYFAVSLPDLLIWEADLDLRNKVHCTYLTGLGYLGAGNVREAVRFLSEVISQDQSHAGAFIHLAMAENVSL